MRQPAFSRPARSAIRGLAPLLYAVLISAMGLLASRPARAADAPIIENERVVVRDVTLMPGVPGPAERHEHDFVVMFLTDGKIRTTSAGGKSSVAIHHAREAIFGRKGTEEKLEVLSAAPVRMIVIDLKEHPVPPLVNKSGYVPAFPRPGSHKVLENDRVVVWNYVWKPGVPSPMHYHDKEVVVAYTDNGSLKSTTPDGKSVVTDYTFGDVRFNKADRIHSEMLVKGSLTAVMTELK